MGFLALLGRGCGVSAHAKPIYLPVDFFLFIFYYLRFVQTT